MHRDGYVRGKVEGRTLKRVIDRFTCLDGSDGFISMYASKLI